MTKRTEVPVDLKALEIEQDGDLLWPPRGSDWAEHAPRFYDWADGVYVDSGAGPIAGPFPDLANAIRTFGHFDAQMWLDGKVILRHLAESGYGSSGKTIKALRGRFAVFDDFDGSMEGHFRSLKSAIAKTNILEVGPASTEIWCESLSTSEIVSQLTLFQYEPNTDGFISVNGEMVTHEQFYQLRHVDHSDVILTRLRKQLRSAIRLEVRRVHDDALKPLPKPTSFVQAMFGGNRSRASDAPALRCLLRDIAGAPAAEALARLSQSDATRDWSDVADLREAMRREALAPKGNS